MAVGQFPPGLRQVEPSSDPDKRVGLLKATVHVAAGHGELTEEESEVGTDYLYIELVTRFCPLVLRWTLRTVLPLFRWRMWVLRAPARLR